MKRILITGKDSYIGTSVEKYLARYPDKYIVNTIDVRDRHWKEQDFGSYDTVYHVAGIAHSDTKMASAEEQDLYYSVNTDLTLDVAKKAKEDGVRQFIFMSSIIVYGEESFNRVGTSIDQLKMIGADTPLSPTNFYGDSKKRAEEGLALLQSPWPLVSQASLFLRSMESKKPDETIQAAENFGDYRSNDGGHVFKVCILRPPMIYGKGCKGNYPTLSRLAQTIPFFPKVTNYRSMLYNTNLCEFVRLMIDNEEEGVFFPQNKTYVNTSCLVKGIAFAHGKRIALIPGTLPFLKLISRFIPLVDKAFGSLIIDKKLSVYRDRTGQTIDYQMVGMVKSIKETESE